VECVYRFRDRVTVRGRARWQWVFDGTGHLVFDDAL